MEPIPAVVGLFAISLECINSARELYDMRARYKDASTLITTIYSESMIVASSLSQLQNLFQGNKHLLEEKPDLFSALNTALTSCRVVYAALYEDVKALGEKAEDANLTRMEKVKWSMREPSLKDLLGQIRGQQQALGLLIQGLQMESLADIRKLVQENSTTLHQIASRSKSLRETHPNVNNRVPDSICGQDRARSMADVQSLLTEADFAFDDEVVNSKAYRRAMRIAEARAQGADKQDVDTEGPPDSRIVESDLTKLHSPVASTREQDEAGQDPPPPYTEGSEKIIIETVMPEEEEIEEREIHADLFDNLEAGFLPFMPPAPSSSSRTRTNDNGSQNNVMPKPKEISQPDIPQIQGLSQNQTQPEVISENRSIPEIRFIPELSSTPDVQLPREDGAAISPAPSARSSITSGNGEAKEEDEQQPPLLPPRPRSETPTPLPNVHKILPYPPSKSPSDATLVSALSSRGVTEPQTLTHRPIRRKPLGLNTKASSDVLRPKGSSNILRSMASSDILRSMAPSDILRSKASSDVLRPKASGDILRSKASSDVLRSKASSDILRLLSSDTTPTIRVANPSDIAIHNSWASLVKDEEAFIDRVLKFRRLFYDAAVVKWPALEKHIDVIRVAHETLVPIHTAELLTPMEMQLSAGSFARCNPAIFEAWVAKAQRGYRRYFQRVPHAENAIAATLKSDKSFAPWLNGLGLSILWFGKGWSEYLRLPVTQLEGYVERFEELVHTMRKMENLQSSNAIDELAEVERVLDGLRRLQRQCIDLFVDGQQREELRNLERRIRTADTDILARLDLLSEKRVSVLQGKLAMRKNGTGPWQEAYVVLTDNFLFWGQVKAPKGVKNKDKEGDIWVVDSPIATSSLTLLPIPTAQGSIKSTMKDDLPRRTVLYPFSIRDDSQEPLVIAHSFAAFGYAERKAWMAGFQTVQMMDMGGDDEATGLDAGKGFFEMDAERRVVELEGRRRVAELSEWKV